ncbi:MAG: hypothetical protein LBH90_01920 [Tannerella sp.]|jgi:hypothetical protein|nr:hypothetical protein [Tannerella sp.]
MRLLKKMAATIIATLFAAGIFAQTEIRTADELAAIGQDIASLKGGSYILLHDITVENWEPLGLLKTSFEGVFNGNGHTITINSLSSNETKSDSNAPIVAGLFCEVGKNGVVKNLKITGEIVYNSGTRTLHIGAIAGINLGTIQNCVSTCKITTEGGKNNFGRTILTGLAGAAINRVFLYENGVYAGGLVGLNSGKIENCYSASHISIDGKGIKCGGGIAGGNGSSEGGTIAQCFATGIVTTIGAGSTGRKGSHRAAGGIAGLNCSRGFIENCVALNESLTARDVSCVVGLNFQFDAGQNPLRGIIKDSYYQKGILIFSANGADKDEKATRRAATGKGMEGLPVEMTETQTQAWWETPKGRRSKFAFAFGTDDDAPWSWSDTEKHPVLSWEHKQGTD